MVGRSKRFGLSVQAVHKPIYFSCMLARWRATIPVNSMASFGHPDGLLVTVHQFIALGAAKRYSLKLDATLYCDWGRLRDHGAPPRSRLWALGGVRARRSRAYTPPRALVTVGWVDLMQLPAPVRSAPPPLPVRLLATGP
eukprot:6179809-Pleurochrysis_carterae.AAC.1